MDWWLNKATFISVHTWQGPHCLGSPWITPSESHRESQKQAETPATSSSEPSTGAMATPVVETPVTQTPVTQAPAIHSDTPAPMETGGAGDSQSWAK